jgi:DMSO/TMAO reductase YedYZ molybdopterin-dependent catalytic subunit
MLKRTMVFAVLAVGVIIAGCARQPAGSPPTVSQGERTATATESMTQTASPTGTPSPTSTPEQTLTSQVGSVTASCGMPPIVAPTAAPNPGIYMEDQTTGLHMTGRPVKIDLENYRLKVTGLVAHPLSLSYDELRCMPKVSAYLLLECIGFFEDSASWSGVPLQYILDLAGVQSDAKWIHMFSADGYDNQMALQTALEKGSFLAYEWEGEPLPVLHGFPLRAILPSLPGNHWVKWLLEIKIE